MEMIDFEFTSIGDEHARHLLHLNLRGLNTWQTPVSAELNQQFEELVEANRTPP